MRLVAAALAIVFAQQVSAQIIDPYNKRIAVGARVRFRSPDNAKVVEGRVQSIDGDMMAVFSKRDGYKATSLLELNAIEVRGKRNELAYALGVVGALVGTGWYLNWCARSPKECQEQDSDDDDDGMVDVPPMFQLMAIGTGAAFGLVGYALTPTTWQRVPVLAGMPAPARQWEFRLGFKLRR